MTAFANDDLPSIAEIAGEWCVRLSTGALTPDQQAAFDTWMMQDPANAFAFDRALTVWGGLHAISDQPEIIAKRAEALDALRRANQRRWSLSGERSRWGVGLVASFLVVAFTSVWFLVNRPTEFATGVGERRAFLLADGSRLSLDAETRVAVDLERDHRELRLLAGRAKFDVAKDLARPFTVTAADRTVVATGTAFSVELLGSQVHVILYEGSVAVMKGPPPPAPQLLALKAHPGPGAAKLKPGNELIAEVQQPIAPQVVQADVARSLAWEGGQLNFVDEPLSSAVERLNRYTSTKIVVGDPKSGAITVNGVFNAGDSAAFVEAIKEAYPVRVRRGGDEVMITSAISSQNCCAAM